MQPRSRNCDLNHALRAPAGTVVIPATATQYGPISFTDTVAAPGDYIYKAYFAGEGALPAAESAPIEVPARIKSELTLWRPTRRSSPTAIRSR